MLVSAHPSSPELGLGLGRAGWAWVRVGLGLGCAIGDIETNRRILVVLELENFLFLF